MSMENYDTTIGGFGYDHPQLISQLAVIIRQHVTEDAWAWLQEKISKITEAAAFNTAFAAIPRKTGKRRVEISEETQQAIKKILPGFTIQHWTVDRLSRVWLLMHLPAQDQEKYVRTIEQLFPAGEMNELVALYSALPVLAYPGRWIKRCAEGIRNNIGDVLQAIMYQNPYPAKYLPEAAWNQLILKAFFTEKDMGLIMGADERSNQELADILSDYAHERWAAHRPVPIPLWRFVARHLNEKIFPDIQKIATSGNPEEKAAAIEVCRQSMYPPAKKLLEQLSVDR